MSTLLGKLPWVGEEGREPLALLPVLVGIGWYLSESSAETLLCSSSFWGWMEGKISSRNPQRSLHPVFDIQRVCG